MDNCNPDISQGIVVYDKSGTSLATVTSSTDEFTPTGANDWRNEAVDLSLYIGQSNLQLAFVGYNDWGNNLYIDNISLTTDPVYDVTLKEVFAPSPVLCLNQVTPVLKINNAGTLITSLKVMTIVNGQTSMQILSGLTIPGNSGAEIELNSISLIDGENEISFELTEPNGETDFNPADNNAAVKTIVNKAGDAIPLRQNFDGSFEDQWTMANPSDGMQWQPTAVGINTAVYVNGFNNNLSGDKSWLVSPVLDFSQADEASISYDLSYAARSNTSDILYILASTNCGYTYNDTLSVLSGPSLSGGKNSTTSWKPQNESDWTNKTLDLSAYSGQQEMRVAFVFVNDNGNNVYIDNMEFFVSAEPLKLTETFAVYPNPIEDDLANVTFNLAEKGTVSIDIMDSMGKILISETYSGILNQTFPFSLSGRSSGVYFVRIKTGDQSVMKKVVLVK
ncbi:MAG: hypothetical protein C0490_13565 [Marivirga sp.]|nr:hypothetical protein [Marivirga sp.]